MIRIDCSREEDKSDSFVSVLHSPTLLLLKSTAEDIVEAHRTGMELAACLTPACCRISLPACWMKPDNPCPGRLPGIPTWRYNTWWCHLQALPMFPSLWCSCACADCSMLMPISLLLITDVGVAGLKLLLWRLLLLVLQDSSSSSRLTLSCLTLY